VIFDCLGGNDKNAVVFNKDTEQVVAILQGHAKKVTGVIYHPDEVVFCSFHLHMLVLLQVRVHPSFVQIRI